MAQVRDLETLRRAERYILCGLGFAVLLFLIYASTSSRISPPLKGLPKPANVFADQSMVRTFYTLDLDAADREVWNSLDVKLQIQGFNRPRWGYPWVYRNAKGEQVNLVVGEWRPYVGPEGMIDGRNSHKITLVHIVRNESWKMMWTRFLSRFQARHQTRVARMP